MFCGKCGSLGFPDSDGIIACQPCGKSNKMAEEITLDNGSTVSMVEVKDFHVADEACERPIIVGDGRLRAVNTSYYCPKCGENETWTELRQMDQTDEPEVLFLTCKPCGHGWRD